MNALRAQQRFALNSVGDGPSTPAQLRDLILSVLQAAAYTKEALKIIRGDQYNASKSQEVATLAATGGVPSPVAERVKSLEDQNHPASQFLGRVRNKLAFHWDPSLLDSGFNEAVRGGQEIVWVEAAGDADGELVYRVVVDAMLTSAIPPADLKAANGDHVLALNELVPHLNDAMAALLSYYDYALLGFLKMHDAVQRER